MKIQASQEAHEAIRPALVSSYASSSSEDSEHASGHFCPPIDLPESLQSRERSLYDLIYRRTLASAMAESVADFTTVMLGGRAVGEGPNTDNAVSIFTGSSFGRALLTSARDLWMLLCAVIAVSTNASLLAFQDVVLTLTSVA